MKKVEDLKELEGKEIQKAFFVDLDESIVLVFDDSYTVIDVNFYGDSHDLVLDGSISDSDRVICGLMTDDEYKKKRLKEENERKAMSEEIQRKQYESLKLKFDK